MAVSEEDAAICRVFFAVLSIINIIGNTLVILSVLRNRSMQTNMNYLLVNLAIADILVGIFLLPRYVFDQVVVYPNDLRADIICKLLTYAAVSWVGLHAQVFTLIVISFERYNAVVHPHSSRRRLNKRKLKIVLVASWLYAFSFNMPYFVLLEYDYEKKACVKEWSQLAQKIWAMMWLVTCGPIPLFSMGYLYGKVVYNLWIKKSRVTDASRIAVNTSRKRVTKMVITVAVIYAICWLPNLIVFNFKNYLDNISFLDLLYMISHIFLLVNSTVNPFVYSIQSRTFRKAMLGSLFFWKSRIGVSNSLARISYFRDQVSHKNSKNSAIAVKGGELSRTLDCYAHVTESETHDSHGTAGNPCHGSKAIVDTCYGSEECDILSKATVKKIYGPFLTTSDKGTKKFVTEL